jgi:hypothetical protein
MQKPKAGNQKKRKSVESVDAVSAYSFWLLTPGF